MIDTPPADLPTIAQKHAHDLWLLVRAAEATLAAHDDPRFQPLLDALRKAIQGGISDA